MAQSNRSRKFPKPEGPAPSVPIIKKLEPSFNPENQLLASFIEEKYPKYELFGPRTSIPNMEVAGASKGQNLVFVTADLTGNGYEDYVAIMRSKYHEEIGFLMAFLQEEDDNISDIKLGYAIPKQHYLYPIRLGDLRTLAKDRRWDLKGTFVTDSSHSDNLITVVVSRILFDDTKIYMFTETKGCSPPYCMVKVGA